MLIKSHPLITKIKFWTLLLIKDNISTKNLLFKTPIKLIQNLKTQMKVINHILGHHKEDNLKTKSTNS